MSEQRKTVTVFARITADTKRKWDMKASRYGVPSAVLRELIVAFIENRLIVSPPAGYVPETKENLFDVGN